MKSICFCGNFAHFSGALEAFRHLARACKARGWKTGYTFHQLRTGDIFPDLSMFDEVKYMPDAAWEREVHGAMMAAWANQFDIIHTSLLPMDWRYCFKMHVKRPMLETYHSPDGWKRCWKQYQYRLMAGIEKPATYTVAVSKGLGQQIQSDLKLPVKVVYNGVVIPEKPQWDGQYVTYAGRLSHDKGLDDWLKVAWRVKAQIPNAKFQWIGELSPGYDDHAFRVLQAHFPWLSVTGFTNDPGRFYRRAACLLMTSPSEGLPMVILEAMAHGVPVVSYPVGDIPETGCALAHDVNDATDKVLRILRASDREAWAESLHRHTRVNFSAEQMNDQYLSLYESLL